MTILYLYTILLYRFYVREFLRACDRVRRRPRITAWSVTCFAAAAGATERLQLLARVRRADTAELLRRAELRPGMRCLDLGCGGGEVTFELARLAGPSGSVVGIDLTK